MATNESLTQRIKAEFDARAQHQKTEAQEKAQRQKTDEQRLAMFNKACDDLKSVWGPKIDSIAKQFGQQVKLNPKIEPERRQATAEFITDMASVTLALAAILDSASDKLVLNYDLRIVPMFIEYERSARLEMPLNEIDRDAVGKWIDDRLVACVKTYLSLQDNEFYRERAMVEDPITKERFLKDKAAEKFDHNGRIMYFASQDSLKQYKQKHQLDQPKPAAAAVAEPKPPQGSTPATKPAPSGKDATQTVKH